MHAILAYNSEILPAPWTENSDNEATTPNKDYRSDEPDIHHQSHLSNYPQTSSGGTDHLSSFALDSIPGSFSSSSEVQYQYPPRVKRHCTESLWNTTRRAPPPSNQDTMMMDFDLSSTLSQSGSDDDDDRKRALHHEQNSLSASHHPQQMMMANKKSRCTMNAELDETMLMQGESPPEAEDVWKFIGIG